MSENLVAYAGFNKSKHQMTTEEMPLGTPPTSGPLGTEMALIAKDTANTFNQVALKSRYFDVIDYVRDENILNRIAAGEFVGSTHLQVSMTFTGEVAVTAVATGLCWAAQPVNSVSINIPVESGWAKDGSTVYLTNVAKRLFEKVRETFLVYS